MFHTYFINTKGGMSMAHFIKYKQANTPGSLIAHDERTNTDHREHIDPTLSSQNINFVMRKNSTEFLGQKLEEVKRSGGMVRDNAVVMCSCIITLPKDFSSDKKLQKKFFEHCVEFLHKDFGAENCISAVVHYDEPHTDENGNTYVSPHLHYKFVPIVEKTKHYKDNHTKKILSLDAKHIISRDYLLGFHDRLQEYLECSLLRPCNVVNGASKGASTVKALKELDTLHNEIDRLNGQITALQSIVSQERKLQNELFYTDTDSYFPNFETIFQRIDAVKQYSEQIHCDGYTILQLESDISAILNEIDKITPFLDSMYRFIREKEHNLDDDDPEH